MGVRAQMLTTRIWEAQGKCCSICGERMTPVHKFHPDRGWTIEHVFNRASKRFHTVGNKLVSHSECNHRKGDRDPTGCEVILLHAVNAKLGFELKPRPPREYLDRLPWPAARIRFVDEVKGPSALALALQQAMSA